MLVWVQVPVAVFMWATGGGVCQSSVLTLTCVEASKVDSSALHVSPLASGVAHSPINDSRCLYDAMAGPQPR